MTESNASELTTNGTINEEIVEVDEEDENILVKEIDCHDYDEQIDVLQTQPFLSDLNINPHHNASHECLECSSDDKSDKPNDDIVEHLVEPEDCVNLDCTDSPSREDVQHSSISVSTLSTTSQDNDSSLPVSSGGKDKRESPTTSNDRCDDESPSLGSLVSIDTESGANVQADKFAVSLDNQYIEPKVLVAEPLDIEQVSVDEIQEPINRATIKASSGSVDDESKNDLTTIGRFFFIYFKRIELIYS